MHPLHPTHQAPRSFHLQTLLMALLLGMPCAGCGCRSPSQVIADELARVREAATAEVNTFKKQMADEIKAAQDKTEEITRKYQRKIEQVQADSEKRIRELQSTLERAKDASKTVGEDMKELLEDDRVKAKG